MLLKKEASTDPKTSHSIEHDLLEQVFTHLPAGLLANVINSAILAFVLRDVVPHSTLGLWVMAVWFVTFVRSIHYFLYRYRSHSPERYQLCKTLFCSGVVLSGTVWGSAGIFLFPESSYPHQAFIVFLLGGMVAGSLVSFSEFKRVAGGYAWLLLLPVIISLFAAGDEIHVTMAALTIIFGIIMILTSIQLHRVKTSSLLLLHEKNLEILERKKIEKNLQKLSRAVEQSPVSIIITDNEGTIEYVNRTFSEVTGYSFNEAIGQNPRILKSGNQSVSFYEELWATIKGGRDWSGDFINKKKNGEDFWEKAVISPILNDHQEITHFVAVKEDITEQKHFADILKESERRYRSVVNTTSEGYWQLDMNNETVAVNKALLDLLGYEQEEMIGKKPLNFVDDENRKIFIEQIKKIDSTEHRTYEIALMTKEGRNIHTLFSATTLKNEKGEVRGAFAFITDISLRKEYEKGLQAAKEIAIKASRSKSDFLAKMSHEIRTPMNAIVGMTDLALETKLDSHQRFFLETVKVSADSLLLLINDILDFSKIEAGKLELEAHPFDIAKSVGAAVQTVQVLAKDKGLTLQVDINPSVPVALRGDSLRLRQILINLLSNAIKFTAEGSVLVKVIKVATTNEKVELRISVIDTGIGITPEMKEHIFDSFSQEDSGTTRKYGGTGLGLAICRQLCRLMGGDIEVESEPGRGSIFSFSSIFDPAELSELEEIETKGEGVQTVPALNILLVEDNEINRMLAEFILQRDEHQLTMAGNGLEALDKLTEGGFDVVLMDVEMPKMDGYTTTKVIRAMELGLEVSEDLPSGLSDKLAGRLHGGHLLIIAMTAHAMSGVREKCIQCGMDDYLSKPFKQEDFYKMLGG